MIQGVRDIRTSSTKLIILSFALLILGGCATNNAKQQEEERFVDPRDPIEPVNRVMWDLNYEVLDRYLLKPATQGYVAVMPQAARNGLYNMAVNLEEPSNTVNNLLQGKVDESFVSLGRFVINSTIGLLGAFDVATEMGLQREEESFGEVLAVWGVGTGAYLMLPALGPSDIRSTAGDVVDGVYFPFDILNFNFTIFRATVKALEARAALLSQDQMISQSLDPYVLVREIYFQNLEFKVSDGAIEEDVDFDDEFDDFLDDVDFDDDGTSEPD